MPACRECRRRKLGCSKEQPACKECRRLGAECVYEPKEKPGLKGGAVENLNRRVDKLEGLLQQLQQRTEPASSIPAALISSPHQYSDSNARPASELLRSFERELRKFNSIPNKESANAARHSNFLHEDISEDSSASFNHDLNSEGRRKRKRFNPRGAFTWEEFLLPAEFTNVIDSPSPVGLLDAVVNSYFSQVHPWIPMLHEINLRRQISQQVYRPDLEAILHAMIAATLRFAAGDTTINDDHVMKLTKNSRDWVVLNSMNFLSVENLQALTIIAFDDIGNGNSSSAWSIVGSLTRTVEYLQLSVEHDEDSEQPLLKPCPSLLPPSNWTDMETRRRVFWNIFNLDRFCSVVTGWNTSLTSDDVYRRLPADGALWRKQESVLTPYFGIWDKAAGKIGNSIAYLPTHYPSPTQGSDHQSPVSVRFDSDKAQQADQAAGISTIGAFAYCIEATESMSRVTTYFLQQKINLKDQKQVSSWLTRFKELDLRLVHWKMFLPQKWKDTNISRRPAEVIMDPNLTLAHITHNASMILLHQVIAYPPSDWEWASKLPSRWSADTCQAAAVETSSITENYLTSPTVSKIVNSQFVFCVFVAARVLLVHYKHYEEQDLLIEFSKLLNSLDTISIRWRGGLKTRVESSSNLAAKYATQLRRLQATCTSDPSFRINVLGYANELGSSSLDAQRSFGTDEMVDNGGYSPRQKQVDQQRRRKSSNSQARTKASQRKGKLTDGICGNPRITGPTESDKLLEDSASVGMGSQLQDQSPPLGFELSYSAIPTAPNPASAHSSMVNESSILNSTADFDAVPENALGMDDLNPISQMFLDQQFLEMDRVISYNEGLFSANMGWWNQDS